MFQYSKDYWLVFIKKMKENVHLLSSGHHINVLENSAPLWSFLNCVKLRFCVSEFASLMCLQLVCLSVAHSAINYMYVFAPFCLGEQNTNQERLKKYF